MRSKLLSSVALASFAVVALPHSAFAAASVKIGGSYEANMSWAEQSRDTTVVNTPAAGGLVGRLRLQFDPSMTVDSLTVGARLRTNAANGTYGYDKAYGYVNTSFGNISFGYKGLLGYAGTWGEVYGNDGQGMVGPDQASVATKAFKGDLDWRIDGAMGNYVDAAGGAPNGTGNGNVVQYETPNLGGFVVGVSYAPQWGANAKDWGNSRDSLTTAKELTPFVPGTAAVDGKPAVDAKDATYEITHGASTNLFEVAAKYGYTGKDLLGAGQDLSVNIAAGYLHAQAPRGTGLPGDGGNLN
ncbi:MAG: porin, partial [Alphaproteobacteria bacterium]|nr:porin [Alphaproteobacteria bacterium]